MSSLDQVRERLLKINSRKVSEHNQSVDQGETSSADQTETCMMTWRERIHQNGNQPADWVKYLRFMRDNMVVKSHKALTELNNMYADAFKAIPPHLTRKNRDHAQLMVDLATFRSEHWEEEARQIFLQARSLCKHFAFVHIAAAQFELNAGNQSKAKKILEKANSERAQPAELLVMAMTNLLMNKSVLVDEETSKQYEGVELMPTGDDESKENIPILLNPRPSAPTPLEMKYSGNQLSGVLDSKLSGSSFLSQKYSNTEPYRSYLSSKASNLCHAKASGTASTYASSAARQPADPEQTPVKDVKLEVPSLNVTTRKLSNIKEKNVSPSSGDGTTSATSEILGPASSSNPFKQPTPSIPGRERHASQGSHSDDSGDSLPLSYDVHRNVFVRSSASKLRSYNSTPDCKSSGFLSSVKKRRPPMRVPASSSLKELNEEGVFNEDASFHLQPLPETPQPVTRQSSCTQESTPPLSDKSQEESTLHQDSVVAQVGDSKNDTVDAEPVVSDVRRFCSEMDVSECNHQPPSEDGHQSHQRSEMEHLSKLKEFPRRRAPLKREESMETDQKLAMLRMQMSVDVVDELLEPMDIDATGQHRGNQGGSSFHQHSLSSAASSSVIITPATSANHVSVPAFGSTTLSTQPPEQAAQPVLNIQRSPLMPRAEFNQGSGLHGVAPVSPVPGAHQHIPHVMQAPVGLQHSNPAMQPMMPGMQAAMPVMMQPPMPASVSQPNSGLISQQGVPGMQQANSWMAQPMPQNPNKMLIVNGEEYMVLKTLGKGGSSTVYQVLTKTKETRAVKVVDMSQADEAVLRSFLNEIALLQRLQHSERVIHMYDHLYSAETNTLFVVMEEGQGDLFQHFRAAKQGIGPVEQKYFWKQMLEAVAVLHKEGIVHCDLKPANFILVNGQVKLIDFGIANAIQQDKTSVTCYQILGTLNFMSPEAIMDTQGSPDMESGKSVPKFKISVKSDVWSLGCILYSLVYGCTPFHRVKHQIAKMQAIINPNYEIEFKAHPDKHLVNVLKSCLKRDPMQRPSIEELLNHPYLIGESVTGPATPTTPGGQTSMKEVLKRQLDSVNLNSPGSINALMSAMQGLLNQKMSGKS